MSDAFSHYIFHIANVNCFFGAPTPHFKDDCPTEAIHFIYLFWIFSINNCYTIARSFFLLLIIAFLSVFLSPYAVATNGFFSCRYLFTQARIEHQYNLITSRKKTIRNCNNNKPNNTIGLKFKSSFSFN